MDVVLTKLHEWYLRLRGQPLGLDLRPYREALQRINAREPALTPATDTELRRSWAELTERIRGGDRSDARRVEAFALVREAARRVLGLRAYDVQIVAALALQLGRVTDVQTGEGKTLSAVFAAAFDAIDGHGVHVLTVNDYLARRDALWMGGVYELLGLTVGFVQEGMSTRDRQTAYRSDITYVAAPEAGFDYLRDRLCTNELDLVRRPRLNFAIVDEADSILIDEARIPLVIAGDTTAPVEDHRQLIDLVRALRPQIDWVTDAHARNVRFTAQGQARIEHVLGCGCLQDEHNVSLMIGLSHALHAEILLRRDIDYVVRDDQIEVVDELTGRVALDRRWPDGLQAALCAKEGLSPPRQGDILGSIPVQHFLQRYDKLAGMTGTARSAVRELLDFYGLEVVIIPTHRPCIREDLPDVIFGSKEHKERALVAEIAAVHATERPILVGTASVFESERLAAQLAHAGVSCEVLNAKNDHREAAIIAEAGRPGAVTISTNMAGRGTDIRLGGADQRERARVVELGGLFVIGTNRHESPRIDDQLRGRAGRQGDPGSSRFFVSVQDDLFRRFGLPGVLPHVAPHALDDPTVAAEIDRAQRIVDNQNYEIRKTLWRYSELLEDQRRLMQDWRQDVLRGAVTSGVLAHRAPDRNRDLSRRFGAELVLDVERRITLAHLDRAWADHLAQVGHVRDGIHLVAATGFHPWHEFLKEATTAFEGMRVRVEDAIVATFVAADITENGIDLEKEGLQAPASTWTYLINDTAMGTPIGRLFSRVTDRMTAPLRRALGLRSRP